MARVPRIHSSPPSSGHPWVWGRGGGSVEVVWESFGRHLGDIWESNVSQMSPPGKHKECNWIAHPLVAAAAAAAAPAADAAAARPPPARRFYIYRKHSIDRPTWRLYW